MADVRISQLPVATNLQASDIAPFVSGGITTQASASQVVVAGLPSQTGHPATVLGTDGTNLSWVTAGTVTSVGLTTSLSGLTITGSPVTTSGSFALAGTLGISSGGTGQTTAAAALTALLPAQTGQNGKVLGTDGTVASWVAGGTNITITPDSTTATAVYPAFVEATSGTVSALNIDDTHLSYIPSTGELSAEGMTANNGLFYNAAVVNTSVTVPAGFNALSAGPIVAASGVTVTVNAPSTWKVV